MSDYGNILHNPVKISKISMIRGIVLGDTMVYC